MKSVIHLTVILIGCIGLFLGGFLVDLDHKGSLIDKISCFFGNCPPMDRGIFHNPIVASLIITFTSCFTIAYIIHLSMDGIF